LRRSFPKSVSVTFRFADGEGAVARPKRPLLFRASILVHRCPREYTIGGSCDRFHFFLFRRWFRKLRTSPRALPEDAAAAGRCSERLYLGKAGVYVVGRALRVRGLRVLFALFLLLAVLGGGGGCGGRTASPTPSSGSSPSAPSGSAAPSAPATPRASEQGGGEATQPVEGARAPQITVTTPEGESFSLQDVLGKKPVFLHFFYSRCPYCREEMGEIVSAYRTYRDQIAFVLVDALDHDSPDRLREFLASVGYDGPYYMDLSRGARQVYRIGLFPTSVFIAADGTIVRRADGAMFSEDMAKSFRAIAQTASASGR